MGFLNFPDYYGMSSDRALASPAVLKLSPLCVAPQQRRVIYSFCFSCAETCGSSKNVRCSVGKSKPQKGTSESEKLLCWNFDLCHYYYFFPCKEHCLQKAYVGFGQLAVTQKNPARVKKGHNMPLFLTAVNGPFYQDTIFRGHWQSAFLIKTVGL